MQVSRYNSFCYISKTWFYSSVIDKIIGIKNNYCRRIRKFFSSIKTVAGEFIDDADKILDGRLKKKEFMIKYGHLRPGTYDIRSQRYDKIEDYFKKGKVSSNKDNQESLNFLKKLNKTYKNYLKKKN